MKNYFLESGKEKVRRFRKERDDEYVMEDRRVKEKKRQKYIDEKRRQKRSEVWDA